MFGSVLSAVAAGFVSGVPLLRGANSTHVVRTCEQLTAGRSTSTCTPHQIPRNGLYPLSRRRERHSRGDCERLVSKALRSRQSPGGRGECRSQGYEAFGGVVFNWSSGGVIPAAVEAMVNIRGSALKIGRVVWMPSNDSRNHFERFKIERPPVDVFSGGKLVPAIATTSSASAPSTTSSFRPVDLSPRDSSRSSRKRRLPRFRRSCARTDYDPITMSVDDQKEAARLEAFIEHVPTLVCFSGPIQRPSDSGLGARDGRADRERRAVGGVESSILASDMGAADRDSGGRVRCVLARLRELGTRRRNLIGRPQGIGGTARTPIGDDPVPWCSTTFPTGASRSASKHSRVDSRAGASAVSPDQRCSELSVSSDGCAG